MTDNNFDEECELADRIMAKLLEGNRVYEASNPDVVTKAFGNTDIKPPTEARTLKWRRYKNSD